MMMMMMMPCSGLEVVVVGLEFEWMLVSYRIILGYWCSKPPKCSSTNWESGDGIIALPTN